MAVSSLIHIRGSKAAAGPVIRVSRPAWARFVGGSRGRQARV
nr:DUF397 domain-containing protein [Streptomyces naganishii]